MSRLMEPSMSAVSHESGAGAAAASSAGSMAVGQVRSGARGRSGAVCGAWR